MLIFGEDYFLKENLREYFEALVGLTEYKPFECVGTIDESRTALKLDVDKYEKEKGRVPEFLKDLLNQIEKSRYEYKDFSKLEGENFVPESYLKEIKKLLSH